MQNTILVEFIHFNTSRRLQVPPSSTTLAHAKDLAYTFINDGAVGYEIEDKAGWVFLRIYFETDMFQD